MSRETVPVTPLPVPEGAGVVLYGGVFDPPHLGHVKPAAAARDAVGGAGSWLVYVPAAEAPLKPRASATAADRVRMLRLALRGVERAGIWTDEIDRSSDGPGYWIDTLRRAVSVLGSRPWFLIGSDQAEQFHRWREYRGILELGEPVVMLRGHETAGELIQRMRESGVWSDRELESWRGRVFGGVRVDVNSTELRRALGRGEGGLELVDDGVLEYIRGRGLYSG